MQTHTSLSSPSPNFAPVLIVGGGLAGLSSALFLAWRGVRSVLVEKHPGSSLHPRAVGYTTRTLELLRAAGVDGQIPTQNKGRGRPRRVKAESLAGQWSAELPWTEGADPAEASPVGEPPRPEYSPCGSAYLPQDRMESLLRAEAVRLGADIRLSTTLLSFEQDADGVKAQLRGPDGHEYQLNADFLIGADGNASPVREALGIGRTGHGFMRNVRSVIFRADLDEYLQSGISQFELSQPDLEGMLTTFRDGRWLLMFTETQELDEAALHGKIMQAIGRKDRSIEILSSGRWVLGAFIADRFSSGRVYLAGDAAHTLPPARGGYGANTGIEDAFNLAWKLAAVVSGKSSPALLDSYDAERRPIAWLRHDQILARRDYAHLATEAEKKVPVVEDDAIELGQLYRSAAVLGAAPDLPAARRPDLWKGQPGTRAQHLRVSQDGVRLSTLDLLQRDWTVLTSNARWCQAAAQVSAELGMEVQCLVVSGSAAHGKLVLLPADADSSPMDGQVLLERFHTAFGIGAEGATLVRPDGYVAWRSCTEPADTAATLRSVLASVGSHHPRHLPASPGLARAIRANGCNAE